MSITYSIIYDSLDYAKVDDNLTDVIKTIYFTVKGVDVDGTSAIFKTKMDFETYDSNSFIPFGSVTETVINDWIYGHPDDIIGIAKRSINFQILEIQNSNIVKNSKYPFQ